jgi:hypothetical protein
MDALKDPFETLVIEQDDGFEALNRKPVSAESLDAVLPCATTARLHGFGLDDEPLVTGLPGLHGEIVPARAAIPLLCEQIGCDVVLLFEQGDVRRPIILGVMQDRGVAMEAAGRSRPAMDLQVDDQRIVISAEREIVLRCGEASITLTRAGKVLIKGTYVVSRSSGYNKIKGAAVDIN